MSQDLAADLAHLIRTRRKAAGMSKKELAARSNLSLDAIHRIENGTRQPRLGTLNGIAVALGTSSAEMLGGVLPQKRLNPRIARIMHTLEGQPPVILDAVEKCARAVVQAFVSISTEPEQ